MKRTAWAPLLALGLVFAFSFLASAFINPNFTPVHLVSQSGQILVLEFQAPGKDGKGVAAVTQVLKGEFKPKEITVDFLAMPEALAAQGKKILELIAQGQKQGLLFTGEFKAEGAGVRNDETQPGFLNLGGKWLIVTKGQQDVWEMDRIEPKLVGTFSGGTDMLLRCVKYVLADPAADVPVNEGVDWAAPLQVGSLKQRVARTEVVDLKGDGKVVLFLASPDGDLVYRWNGKTLEAVAAQLGLGSKSLASAWGDFNRDGRLDLASWDGQALSLWSQKPGGAFAAGAAVRLGDALKDGCLSLAALDVGRQGAPGLLAATRAAPVLLAFKEDGSADAKPLVAGEFPGRHLGEAGRCLVADFDNDSQVDVLQLGSAGGFFYKGQAPGVFAGPVETPCAFDQGYYGACAADFDADGLLDIFTVSKTQNHFWQNRGAGKFTEEIGASGSLAYISKPGGNFAMPADINNDGRPDLLITYGTEMTPQIFFNRGFRCFGQARKIDLSERNLLPQAAKGQAAGCLADLTGDGAADLFLALPNRELWLLPRMTEEPALGVTVALSCSSPCAGPLLVQATHLNRVLGAWSIGAGEPGAFLGAREAGPLTLKWRLPGGAWKEKEVLVEGSAMRVYLDKE